MRRVAVKEDVLCVWLGPDVGPKLLFQAAPPENHQAGFWESLADPAEDVDLERQIVLRLEPVDAQEEWSVHRKEVAETSGKCPRGLGHGEGGDQPYAVGLEAEPVEQPDDRLLPRDHAVEPADGQPGPRPG